MLDSFDVDYIELETLMWQTGYLTIKNTKTVFDEIRYELAIPNEEVKISLMSSITEFLTKTSIVQNKDNIKYTLHDLDFTKLELNLKALYASIPYNLFTKNDMDKKEGYYVSVFYAYIKALGLDIVGEDVTNKGRIDLTIKMPNSTIIIEFKVDGKDALAQIKDKRYHEKYLDSSLPIYLVGIEFDTNERNICKLEFEEIRYAY